jgi:uncharacterized protein YqeY
LRKSYVRFRKSAICNRDGYNQIMETKAKLETALKEAMKAGDEVRKRTVRMSLAAIRQMEIDRQVKLDEAGVLVILQKEIKTRKESIEEARKANRADLVAASEAEIAVLGTFMPQAMSADELGALVDAAIAEVGAAASSDMGKVMKVLLPKVAGRAPGDQVSAAVRQRLQK